MSAPKFETFGCRLNAYETEAMKDLAEQAGLTNAVIVNTCAVTNEAVRKARQDIRKMRRANPDATVIVTGCAAQIDPKSFAAMDEVDHVIALKHQGETSADNLAYACWRCNRLKGSDLGSFDPDTGEFAFLFNPRSQLWAEHFTLADGQIVGRSPEARTTAVLLKFNTRDRIQERLRYWGDTG